MARETGLQQEGEQMQPGHRSTAHRGVCVRVHVSGGCVGTKVLGSHEVSPWHDLGPWDNTVSLPCHTQQVWIHGYLRKREGAGEATCRYKQRTAASGGWP